MGERWAVSAALVIGMGMAMETAGANLLFNPSFEEGGEVPAGWELFSPPGCSLRRDPTVSRSGQASAGMDIAPAGAAEYPAFRFALRGVRTGEEYLGKAWARTEGMTDLGGYIVLEFYQGDTRLSFATGDFTGAGDHDWMQLTVRAWVPERADGLKLALVAHGRGRVWFDEAELVRTGEAPPEWTGDRVCLQLRPEQIVCPRLEGLGAQGDTFLESLLCC